MSLTASAGLNLQYLEFHDSELRSVVFEDRTAIVTLTPAYIHRWEMTNGSWTGTGWTQTAEIRISDPDDNRAAERPDTPCLIFDGSIRTMYRIVENIVPLNESFWQAHDFRSSGSVRISSQP